MTSTHSRRTAKTARQPAAEGNHRMSANILLAMAVGIGGCASTAREHEEHRGLCKDLGHLLQGVQVWAIGHAEEHPLATWTDFEGAPRLLTYAQPALTEWSGIPIHYEYYFDRDAGLLCVRATGGMEVSECSRGASMSESWPTLGLCER